MNAQNFTQKTIEAVQTAQSMAQENRNSYITPEHLLYALVDQDGGLIPTLFKRMGVDCDAVLSELDGAIAALPKVGGDSSEVYMSSELSRVLSAAEKAAKSMGDEYLSVEHLMIGIFAAGPDKAHPRRPRHHEVRLHDRTEQGQVRARHRRQPGEHLRRAE